MQGIYPNQWQRDRDRVEKSSSIDPEDLGNGMMVLLGFLTPSECAAFIEFGDSSNRWEPCEQKATREYAFRKQERFAIQDCILADAIFQRLKSYNIIPNSTLDGLVPNACSSNIRLYKYGVGNAFGKHVDESCEEVKEDGTHCWSKYTVLMYLNGSDDGSNDHNNGCDVSAESSNLRLQGGTTAFYTSHAARDPIYEMVPVRGAVLLHAHGHRCLTHEARPVTSGFKYVLRTDVLYSTEARRTPVLNTGTGSKKNRKKK